MRKAAKRIPLLWSSYIRFRGYQHDRVARSAIRRIKKHAGSNLLPKSPGIIVSLTSFPARIAKSWFAVESILQQTIHPDRIFLTLSLTQFPDRRIPPSIQDLVSRGLEILWVEEDTRGYKKLIPIANEFPDSVIITIDDDAIYEPDFIEILLGASAEYPKSVIGFRGWEIKFTDGEFAPYDMWQRANYGTPANRTLLTGVGGILYPVASLRRDWLCNMKQALRVAPTSDDIWFWLSARKSGLDIRCLGKDQHVTLEFDDPGPSLAQFNLKGGGNDRALAIIANEHKDILPQ